jgi:hypothetical protein
MTISLSALRGYAANPLAAGLRTEKAAIAAVIATSFPRYQAQT